MIRLGEDMARRKVARRDQPLGILLSGLISDS